MYAGGATHTIHPYFTALGRELRTSWIRKTTVEGWGGGGEGKGAPVGAVLSCFSSICHCRRGVCRSSVPLVYSINCRREKSLTSGKKMDAVIPGGVRCHALMPLAISTE